MWATTTVLDSEKVADIVGDALDEPEVEAALADYLTTQVFTAVDVDAVLQRGPCPISCSVSNRCSRPAPGQPSSGA